MIFRSGAKFSLMTNRDKSGGAFSLPLVRDPDLARRELVPMYIVVPICRAFGPYLVTAAVVGAAGLIQAGARQYGQLEDAPKGVAAAYLAMNLVAVATGILAMRAVGLFLRHFGVYFGWK